MILTLTESATGLAPQYLSLRDSSMDWFALNESTT